jgi:hypothetical protein
MHRLLLVIALCLTIGIAGCDPPPEAQAGPIKLTSLTVTPQESDSASIQVILHVPPGQVGSLQYPWKSTPTGSWPGVRPEFAAIAPDTIITFMVPRITDTADWDFCVIAQRLSPQPVLGPEQCFPYIVPPVVLPPPVVDSVTIHVAWSRTVTDSATGEAHIGYGALIQYLLLPDSTDAIWGYRSYLDGVEGEYLTSSYNAWVACGQAAVGEVCPVLPFLDGHDLALLG